LEVELRDLACPAAVLNARGALLNEAQNIGKSPTSVAGGEKAPGNWLESTGLLGPGSLTLAGLLSVLMAPCGGSSGFPKEAGRVDGPKLLVMAVHLCRWIVDSQHQKKEGESQHC
jgi:hypothetical protein